MSSSIPDQLPEDASPSQLRQALDYWRIEALHQGQQYWRTMAEMELMRKELNFLKRAERFVCWSEESQRWEVRFEEPKVKNNYNYPE
jgi:hypothetical protein